MGTSCKSWASRSLSRSWLSTRRFLISYRSHSKIRDRRPVEASRDSWLFLMAVSLLKNDPHKDGDVLQKVNIILGKKLSVRRKHLKDSIRLFKCPDPKAQSIFYVLRHY